MVYISHLDLVRLLTRAARRAGLPVALTKGFSPHFRISLKRALKLGVPSEREEGQIILKEHCDPVEIKRRWQQELPSGVEIGDIGLIS